MQEIASINKFRLRRARRSLKADFYEKNFLSHRNSTNKVFHCLTSNDNDVNQFLNVPQNLQNNRSKSVDKIDN